MPKKRHATLSTESPSMSFTLTADFDGLTLTRKHVDGYRREPDGSWPIAPAAAEAFWTQFNALLADDMGEGMSCILTDDGWTFKAVDGAKTYEALGTGDDPRLYLLRKLFGLLSKR